MKIDLGRACSCGPLIGKDGTGSTMGSGGGAGLSAQPPQGQRSCQMLFAAPASQCRISSYRIQAAYYSLFSICVLILASPYGNLV